MILSDLVASRTGVIVIPDLSGMGINNLQTPECLPEIDLIKGPSFYGEKYLLQVGVGGLGLGW